MNEKIFVFYVFPALFAYLSPCLAYLKMLAVLIHRHTLLTILTEFGFMSTTIFMFTNIVFRKLFVTVVAFFLAMKLLFVFFLRIDIIHLSALLTLFDIPSTVTEMSGYF